MTQALARRIALGGALAREIRRLAGGVSRWRPPSEHAELGSQVARAGSSAGTPAGRRCRSSTTSTCAIAIACWRPEPIARAVMFCLMDVSASMDEDKKDLAKRFFTLLYLFLTRKYEKVDLVFIRHTEDAEEVDEDTFFHDPRSGGTVVFSALELADKIRTARYATGWNVYAAQASDGDAFGADPARSAASCARSCCRRCATTPISSSCRRTRRPGRRRYGPNTSEWPRRAARSRCAGLPGREQIYPVFRELFRKEAQRSEELHFHRRRMGFRAARALRPRHRARSRPSSASTPTRTRSRSSPPSRCSTPTPRTGCRSAIRTGRSARHSSTTSRRTARGMQGLAYEIVINSDPCIAYLMEENTMTDAGAGDRARQLRPQLVLQGQLPVPPVDRRRRASSTTWCSRAAT